MFTMTQVKEFPCRSKAEACEEEDRMMLELNATMNNVRASTTHDEKLQQKREHYQNNKEEINKQRRLCNSENQDKIKIQRALYREANREKIREQDRLNRLKDPEKYKEKARKDWERRKLKKQTADSLSV